jgi:hypothetical protein
MTRIFVGIALLLAALLPASGNSFTAQASDAVFLLYFQNAQGNQSFACTATAFERQDNVYRFLTAAHCLGSDRRDRELSADTSKDVYFLTADETDGPKRFWPATPVFVGYQSRTDDFAIFEATSTEDWPTVPLGDERDLENGAAYWNIAAPLGLGKQIQEGTIANLSLDRPVVQGDINWRGTLVLQQTGVNGGSSGSALISKDTQKIVGVLVGSIGQSTIVAVPVSRVTQALDDAANGAYPWYRPEER